ncbi:protein of unknown function [Methanocaldococcus lauensis]|uniref:Uncharacterized protein n=1 Tax=Methanocaldococcus lauensis TaxID=2546128 RepID=A0A8D6PZ29_9EURY|nr:protein of unknown function [Methanocaldococcus lauensis]
MCKEIGTFLYVDIVITKEEIIKEIKASEDILFTVLPTFLANKEPTITLTLNKINKLL